MNATTKDRAGRIICIGDELLMAYGQGTQRVRVREITARGGLKIDRWNASRSVWQSPKGTVSPLDPRFITTPAKDAQP